MQAGLLSREISGSGCRRCQEAEGNTAGGVSASTSADPARSENQGMYGTSMRENREIPSLARPVDTGGTLREREAARLDARGWEVGRSRSTGEPPNKAAVAVAEVGEERGPAKGNTASKTPPGRSAGPGASSALERVREVARRDKDARFTALLHHVDLFRLRKAYWAIRPQAAPGVDEVTWAGYGQDLEAQPAGSARTGASGALPGQAEQAGLHPEGGWAATAARDRLAGGQDRSAGASCCRLFAICQGAHAVSVAANMSSRARE